MAVVVDTLEVAVCDVSTLSWSFTLTVVRFDAPATSAVGLFDKKHFDGGLCNDFGRKYNDRIEEIRDVRTVCWWRRCCTC